MSMEQMVPVIVLLGLLGGAVASDLRRHRIPNLLVVLGLALGLAGQAAYVYRGELKVGGTAVQSQRMAMLANDGGDGAVLEASQDAKALLIAGRPLKEPIVQYGPFVMNTPQEIHQAIADLRAGRLA